MELIEKLQLEVDQAINRLKEVKEEIALAMMDNLANKALNEKKWPQEGDGCFGLNRDSLVHFTRYHNDKADKVYLQLGLITRTREELEKNIQYLKAIRIIDDIMKKEHPLSNNLIEYFYKKNKFIKEKLEQNNINIEDLL
jgi:hypothetical protein